MYSMQRSLTDKLLFDYYLVSSSREQEIFSPYPYYLDKTLHSQMVQSAQVLDNLVRRIIERFIKSQRMLEIDEFSLLNKVLGLKNNIPPFFWARFDAFCREGGGIFFSEFNYDKPCAQREILMSCINSPESSPSSSFKNTFKECFKKHSEDIHVQDKKPRIAIMVDPSHYEEVNLGFLYMTMLEELGYEFILAGGNNFEVNNGKVTVFGEEIDIIIRQYPTEFLNEIPNFDKILELYEQGNVLIVNDPRAIIGQAKSLFSLLWKMVKSNDPFLSSEETETIRRTVPYTRIFFPELIEEIKSNKDSLVLKPVLGRYSEHVYIGRMLTVQEWDEAISYILESNKKFIVQEFCPIRKENTLKFDGLGFSNTDAFGNFGIYLADSAYCGTCVRWSTDYLSRDDVVWISPVGLREKSLYVKKFESPDRDKIWLDINNKAAFEHGFTGGYTGIQQSFSLDALILDNELESELKYASNKMSELIFKTTKFVMNNSELFCPVLGISDSLINLVRQQQTDENVFIGRFDWVIDTKGCLKLLEFNSETPAGMLESLVLCKMIKEACDCNELNPNEDMSARISEVFGKILDDYKLKGKNIGIVSTTYYEDWYNTSALFDCIKNLPYNFVIGEVSGLESRDGKLFLYGNELDAIYRYYPLDWLDSEERFNGIIAALGKYTPSINPPSTLISQSKAFMALIWELEEKGFYTEEEKALIRKYIPRTALSPAKLHTRDFCAKKFFGREGQDIQFGLSGRFHIENPNDYIFQQRVDIQSIELRINTAVKTVVEPVYPVIGTYIIGDKFGGIYTRAGGKITDKWAIYIPTYFKS